MNPKSIPRKHRNHVLEIIEQFKEGLGKHDNYFTNWDEFLLFKEIGISDGWIASNDKDYQALKWLIDINNFISEMDVYEPEVL